MKMKSYERCRERVVKEINGVLQVSQCKFRRKYNGYCKIHAAQHSAHADAGKSADLEADSNADNLSTSQAVA